MRAVGVTAHAIRQPRPSRFAVLNREPSVRPPSSEPKKGHDVTADTPAAYADLIEALTAISVRAAFAIRDEGAKGVRRKADGSPVSGADLAAEAAIRDGLARLDPALPIVSEEQAEHPRPLGDGSYFLVDPLD